MSCEEQFVQIFEVWDEARPYLEMMVSRDEMRLVVALDGGPARVAEVAELLGMAADEAASLLEGAYTRHVVDREPDGDGAARYRAAHFPDRLDAFAKFENWDEIPAADRAAMDRRFLDDFIARSRAGVERVMRGEAPDPRAALPNDTIMLLSEVEEMIEAAEHIVVQPCDCRRLAQNCDRPVETCIWLDDGALAALDRGWGRRLTQREARQLVRAADRKGLMHTADSEWRTRGLHAICNCCACDCYPFRAAQELGSKGVWPRSRYVAALDAEDCYACGLCVQRCHFGSFSLVVTPAEAGGEPGKAIRYDAERCWGCGLCANSCPTGAIAMVPLP